MANVVFNERKLVNEIHSSSKTRHLMFQEIEVARQGYILLKLSTRVQKDILSKLPDEGILSLLNPLDPDDATDIIQVLPQARMKRITESLNDNIKEKVEFLLRFNPKAAAGLMNLNYIIIQKNVKLEDVIHEVSDYEQRTSKFPTILIFEDGKLQGELWGSTLALHRSSNIRDKDVKRMATIQYDSEVPKVVNSFMKNPHNKVVVTDQDGSVLGIIHSSDVLLLMDKTSTKDLYGFAGVDVEESALDSALTKVKFRYKWLIINLGTAFMAAAVVGLFEGTIAKFTLLAIYMPIVAGMGGNAGTQALAVAVRGLVMKEVNLRSSKKLIINEMTAGAINGLINGVIVAIIAIVFNHSPMLGLVIGTAMVVNLVTAGFFGALVPVLMKQLGKDPASSATIFITTATDVIGFFVFLGLAEVLLPLGR